MSGSVGHKWPVTTKPHKSRIEADVAGRRLPFRARRLTTQETKLGEFPPLALMAYHNMLGGHQQGPAITMLCYTVELAYVSELTRWEEEKRLDPVPLTLRTARPNREGDMPVQLYGKAYVDTWVCPVQLSTVHLPARRPATVSMTASTGDADSNTTDMC